MTDLRALGRPFPAILLAALLVRIAVAFWPVIHHADELWQYLEPAHHLAVGPWIETWEYREGARSWLLPFVFAGPMWLEHVLLPQLPPMLGPRLLCVLLSMGLVIGAAGLGGKISRAHGLVAGLVAATWYENAYFAPRTLSEPVAVSLIVAAAWLLSGRMRGGATTAGVLLALAVQVRFQYAPAAGVLAAWRLGSDGDRWRAFALGGAAGLSVGVGPDLVIAHAPFGWMFRNVRANLVENRSALYGVSSPGWYLGELWRLWPGFAVPIVALAGVGARRYPELLAAAFVNLVVHSLIPHKEYRFILLTTTLLVLLAALGSVDVWRRFLAARGMIGLGVAWIVLSAACAGLGQSARDWGNNGRLLAAWRLATTTPDVCGVALYRTPGTLVASYAAFGRPARIYQFNPASAGYARESRAFNVVIAPPDRGGELPDFRRVDCPGGGTDFCVFARPGGCSSRPVDQRFDANRTIRDQHF